MSKKCQVVVEKDDIVASNVFYVVVETTNLLDLPLGKIEMEKLEHLIEGGVDVIIRTKN